MPWHADDLNARLKKMSNVYRLFQRPIGSECESIWPEKWPTERLRERMSEIGSASFARGYRLVPIVEDETPIRAEWLRFWTDPSEYDMLVLSVDPAVSTSTKADRSALVLLGRCSTATAGVEIRVLASTARRVAAPDLLSLIETFDREYNPAVILFESNAAFQGIKDFLVTQAPFGAKIKGVTQSTDKHSRVAAFSVAVENGAFRLRAEDGAVDSAQRELFDEMTTFPFGEHDDLLDAAATGTAYLLDRREPRAW